jgi:hypothetical protein
MIDNRPKTIFCDIDGTLTKHTLPTQSQLPSNKMELLDGTLDKLNEWDQKGYRIILTTGRKEGLRSQTEKQLQEAGIIYDQLIMGIGGGARYIINDDKPDKRKTAFAVNIGRNEGIKNIEI